MKTLVFSPSWVQAGTPEEIWESSYQEEISGYVLQTQEFDKEWEQMQIALPTTCFELEIAGKSPENLTQQIIFEMESKYKTYKNQQLLIKYFWKLGLQIWFVVEKF